MTWEAMPQSEAQYDENGPPPKCDKWCVVEPGCSDPHQYHVAGDLTEERARLIAAARAMKLACGMTVRQNAHDKCRHKPDPKHCFVCACKSALATLEPGE